MHKTLTPDYDLLGNEYFEGYVINESTIEPNGAIYEVMGIGMLPNKSKMIPGYR